MRLVESMGSRTGEGRRANSEEERDAREGVALRAPPQRPEPWMGGGLGGRLPPPSLIPDLGFTMIGMSNA